MDEALHVRLGRHQVIFRLPLSLSPPASSGGPEWDSRFISNATASTLDSFVYNMSISNQAAYQTLRNIFQDLGMKLHEDNVTNMREKRSIDILGEIVHQGIGLSTNRMIYNLEGKMGLLIQGMMYTLESDLDRDRALQALADQGHAIMTFANLHVDQMLNVVGKIDGKINNFMNDSVYDQYLYRNYSGNLEKTQMSILETLVNIQLKLNHQHSAEVLTEMMHTLQLGRIPDRLISDVDIIRGVNKLTRALRKDYPKIKALGRVRNWRTQIQVFWDNKFIKIFTYIDFSYGPQSYEMYRLDSFPIPLQTDSHEGRGYLTLITDHQYIAVNPKQDYYVALRGLDRDRCIKINQDILCPFDLIENHAGHLTCIYALLMDDPGLIMKTCKFKTFLKGIIPAIHFPLSNNNHIIINYGREGILLCRGEDNVQVRLSVFAVINVPCGCMLEINQATLASRNTHCREDINMTIDIQTGMNLPMALAFELDVKNYKGGMLLKN